MFSWLWAHACVYLCVRVRIHAFMCMCVPVCVWGCLSVCSLWGLKFSAMFEEACVNYTLALATGTCHGPQQDLQHVKLQLLTLNTPWKELRAVCTQEAPVLRERRAGQVFRELDVFRSWLGEPNSCISLYLKKHSSHSWWWMFLMTSKTFSTKNYVFDCTYTPSTKITCLLTFPLPLYGAVSQRYLRCYLAGCSPHFAPKKT